MESSRYINYSFAGVKTDSLDVKENIYLSSIITVSPTEDGIVLIPKDATILFIDGVDNLVQLTISLPLKPKYGQVLIITSNIDVANLSFETNGESFGITSPNVLVNALPLRMVYGNKWILI